MTEPVSSPSSLVRVLVAIPDEALLTEVLDMLRAQGYAVAATTSGQKAKAMLDEQPFAAIVADLGLADATGVDVLVAARRVQPDATRVLLAANLTLSATVEAVNEAEVQRLMVKPVQREAFLQHVAHAVTSFQARHKERMLTTTTRAMNETLTRLVQSLRKPENA